MEFKFNNDNLRKIYLTGKSNKYSKEVIKAFIKKVDSIMAVKDENELRKIKGNHFEKLIREKNMFSMSIEKLLNMQIKKDNFYENMRKLSQKL